MVFQGTVNGATLWNLFLEDARHAIHECFYKEVVFHDNLNAYRIDSSAIQNSAIKRSLDNYQRERHKWGRAHQVSSGATKDSQHVLKLLGVTLDVELSIANAVQSWFFCGLEASKPPSHSALLH